MMKNSAKKQQYIFAFVFTLISLLFCRTWYIDTNRALNVDLLNLFILALFIGMTFYRLYDWLILKETPPPGCISQNSDVGKKMYNIEFLRVVFTMEIVVHHTMKSLGIDNRGWLGVEFFFILSGFFLVYSFKKDCSLINFVHKKIVRFVPLLVAGSLLNILYKQNISFSRFLSSVLFMPGTGLVSRHSYLGPAWYLSVLFWVLIFYFYIIKTRPEQSRNLIFAILTFFAGIAWTHGANGHWGDFHTLGDKGTIGYLFNMSFIRGIMNVGLGYFVAIYWKQIRYDIEDKRISFKQYFIFGIIESFILVYSVIMMFNKDLFPGQAIFVNITFIMLIKLWLIRKGFLSNLTNKYILSKLSEYSLATYLCHSCIAEQLIPILKRKYPDFLSEHILVIVIASLIVSILIGVWAHHVIEKPCGRFLKRVLN